MPFSVQVLVHSPYDFPEVTGKGFAIDKEKEVFIAVSAQLTERYCALLANKKKLPFFKFLLEN